MIEALGDRATGAAAAAQVDALGMRGDGRSGAEQGFAFAGFGIGADRQVDEDGAFQYHVEGMQEHHAPGSFRHQIDARALLLQGEEAQVMHRDGGGRDDDR